MSWTSLTTRFRCLLIIAGLVATRWVSAQQGEVEAQREDAAPRVRLQRPSRADELIDEAVIRVLGELTAVGLDVELVQRSAEAPRTLPPLPEGTFGLIAFRRSAAEMVVDIWSPEGGAPYSFRVDVRQPSVSAEVVAVRAVEALRAKWLEYGELYGADLPGPVLEFARAMEPAAPKVEPQPSKEPSTSAERRRTPDSSRHSVPEWPFDWSLQLHGGASWRLDEGSGSAGAGGSLLFGRGAWFGGLLVSGGLQAAEVVDVAGSATVRDVRYLGIGRTEVSLSQAWRGFVQAGFGVTRYSIDASVSGDALLEARDSVETRFCAQLGAGGNWWLGEHAGVYIAAELRGLVSPFRLRMDDRAVETLGAPSAALGLGLSLRRGIR